MQKLLLTLLVCNCARSLAGRLAGCLTFAASALNSRFLEVSAVQRLDVFGCLHSKSPFPKSRSLRTFRPHITALFNIPIIPHFPPNFNPQCRACGGGKLPLPIGESLVFSLRTAAASHKGLLWAYFLTAWNFNILLFPKDTEPALSSSTHKT